MTRFDELIKAAQYSLGLENIAPDEAVRLGELRVRATFIIDELEAAIDFILDDDLHEPADDKLAALHDSSGERATSAATAGQELLNWLLLADELKDRLATLGDFDPALLTEARTLVDALTGVATPTVTERKHFTALRRRLLSLMFGEQAALRWAAFYVWRHHPDLRRQFTSAEERKRRARTRLAHKLAEAYVPPAPPAAPVA